MDYTKLSTQEIRGYDLARSREVEEAVREELAGIRMDPYANQASSSARVRVLKKSLAKVLTVRNEARKKSGDQK